MRAGRFATPNTYEEIVRIAYEVTHDNPTSKALANLFMKTLEDVIQQMQLDGSLPIYLQEQINELKEKTAIYTHTQSTPSSEWVIVHNLDKHPSVTVIDSAGTVVFGEVKYITKDQIVVTFKAGFGGKAYLN